MDHLKGGSPLTRKRLWERACMAATVDIGSWASASKNNDKFIALMTELIPLVVYGKMAAPILNSSIHLMLREPVPDYNRFRHSVPIGSVIIKTVVSFRRSRLTR